MNAEPAASTILRIGRLDGRRFARGVVAGAGRVIRMSPHLNEINVFPVADHDTGSNMAATMRALAAGAHLGKETSLSKVSLEIADSGLLDSRGNSGAILVELFYGLAEAFEGKERVDARQFAAAARAAASRAAGAVAEPKEGTILTVLRVWAGGLASMAERERDLTRLFESSLAVARDAVNATKVQLEVLEESNVVDAGALGFLYFLEGVVELMEKGAADEDLPLEDLTTELAAHGPMVEAVSQHRYCTECLVVGAQLDRPKIRAAVESMGDSVIVAGSSRQARIHMHTDEPGEVFRKLAGFGEVRRQKVEDMERQRKASQVCQTQSVAVCTDAGCDLPDAAMDEFNIHVVPHRIAFGEESYIAKVTLAPEAFYRMLASAKDHPQTSQPAPADYIRTFEFLSSHFQNVVAVMLSGKLSGTFQTGKQLAARISERIRVVDSRSASVGQGLLTLEAAREARAGRTAAQIVEALERRIGRLKSLLCVETLKYLVRGGRVGKLKGLLGAMLGVKPIFQFDAQGGLEVAAKAGRGRSVHDALLEKCLELAAPMSRLKVGIAHADAAPIADRFANEFAKRLNPASILVTPLSPVMGVHGGRNCIGVALLDDLE
jgi:DegV family protein with EDD domain